MDLITGMDAVTVPEHSSPSCIWLSLLCWCDLDGDQFLLPIHPPWRAEVIRASDAKYKLRITVVFPKIVSVKLSSARSQRMSMHKCSLAGINETWTGCRARNTPKTVAVPSKDWDNFGSCSAPAVCWSWVHVLYQILELFHCSSQNGQLSSVSGVLRFIAAVIILLRRAAVFCFGSSCWGSWNCHQKRSVLLRGSPAPLRMVKEKTLG